MSCYFRAKTSSLLSTVILTSSLGACDIPPAYFVEQLDAVPVPAPVLMQRMSGPDCPVRPCPAAAAEASKLKDKDKDVGADFDSDSSKIDNTEPPPAKAVTAAPDKTELIQLKKERDCYRQAEQLARRRLKKLQTETTRTVSALDDVKQEAGSHPMRP